MLSSYAGVYLLVASPLLLGQAYAQGLSGSHPWNVFSDNPWNTFKELREDISSSLQLTDLELIGDVELDLNPKGYNLLFQVSPQLSDPDICGYPPNTDISGCGFTASEINSYADAISSGAFGENAVSFQYFQDEPYPGDLLFDVLFDDTSLYQQATEYRESLSSGLGLNLDQIGDITLGSSTNLTVWDISILPDGSTQAFDSDDFEGIEKAFRQTFAGSFTDLQFDNADPGSLDANIVDIYDVDGEDFLSYGYGANVIQSLVQFTDEETSTNKVQSSEEEATDHRDLLELNCSLESDCRYWEICIQGVCTSQEKENVDSIPESFAKDTLTSHNQTSRNASDSDSHRHTGRNLFQWECTFDDDCGIGGQCVAGGVCL